jgi:two-component system phosphate regulon sensor histidine kinase PhoR
MRALPWWLSASAHVERFSRRQRRLEFTPVRVQQVLRKACRENEQAALSKGISIHKAFSDATILSDGLLLGAALRNLVSNPIKYTQPGGRILLGCRRKIRIDVYDTGQGIPHQQFPRIFEAFTRLDAAKCDGLGIGLFIDPLFHSRRARPPRRGTGDRAARLFKKGEGK